MLQEKGDPMKLLAAGILLFTSIALAGDGPLSLSPDQFNQYLQNIVQREQREIIELEAKLATLLSKPPKEKTNLQTQIGRFRPSPSSRMPIQTSSSKTTTPTPSENDNDELKQALIESLSNDIDAKKSNIESIYKLSTDETHNTEFQCSI